MPEEFGTETPDANAEPLPAPPGEDVGTTEESGVFAAGEDVGSAEESEVFAAGEDAVSAPPSGDIAPSSALPAAVADELAALRRCVEESSQELRKAFADKLAFDHHKEKQIDSLHAELQSYKRDLLARATQPLVSGLVRLHDSFGRMAEHMRGEPPEELTPERFFEVLEGFRDDLEIVLEDHGVTLFREPDERFEPRRQSSRRTVGTPDESRIGTVAGRVRPGFEQGELLLRKEMVDVYVRASSAPEPEGSQ